MYLDLNDDHGHGGDPTAAMDVTILDNKNRWILNDQKKVWRYSTEVKDAAVLGGSDGCDNTQRPTKSTVVFDDGHGRGGTHRWQWTRQYSTRCSTGMFNHQFKFLEHNLLIGAS